VKVPSLETGCLKLEKEKIEKTKDRRLEIGDWRIYR